jgi:hypothetical protein
MSTKEMIEVLQAFERGEKVQCKALRKPDDWSDSNAPSWNWAEFSYRIAPKPKKQVTYKCYSDGYELRWWLHDTSAGAHWKHFPELDKVVEVEE